VLRQAGDVAARAAYEAALALDPLHHEAHQGLSYLLECTDDEAAGRHRALGFANRVLTTAPSSGVGPRTSVLQIVSAHGGNIPTREILDAGHCIVHTLVAEFATHSIEIPQHDVVFNAIGDADRCAQGLTAAVDFLSGRGTRVINPPEKILPTTREYNARRLGALAGVIAPRITSFPRAVLAAGPPSGFSFPFLVRSPGFQTGEHFVRIESQADLSALLALPGERLMALEYLNARGPDGAARKYRAMFIGGTIYPIHLAISASWKVHYFTAGMNASAAHRAEEQRYLSDMSSVLGPVAMAALERVQAMLDLDYGGIDFAVAEDGRLMLFEANATMILTRPAADDQCDYRRPAFDRARTAARRLVLPIGTGTEATN
jgi:glutathione synthase/RimK-type ligase-like ATP-grasp enzyme